MTNDDIENLFMSFAIHIFFLVECSFFCPFKNELLVLLSFESSLYILDTGRTSDIYILQIFSPYNLAFHF